MTTHIHTDSLATYNMLMRLADQRYKENSTREILKRNCWPTWEAINTLLDTKNIQIKAYKVIAHSGDTCNDIADAAAKEAARLDFDMEIHNSEQSRIAFALKHRKDMVEENPRRYLRHLTQNVCRGEWITHHTSEVLASTHKTDPID